MSIQAYALAQLEEQDDDQQRAVVAQHMHVFGRITMALVAALKALSWQGLLATSPQVLFHPQGISTSAWLMRREDKSVVFMDGFALSPS